MKRKIITAILFTSLIFFFYIDTSDRLSKSEKRRPNAEIIAETDSFELKTGDILVRPNWSWLPGSCDIEGGRKYGHVAIVTEGACEPTIDGTLSKAKVIEALFFDQKTRKFQFSKKDQIRETNAAISFGKRFKGIRYRLRIKLTNEQLKIMIRFLRKQLDGGYNILDFKKIYESAGQKKFAIENLQNKNWHCATIAWESFYLIDGIDIDANKGLLVYPSDIIASKNFDLPGGRINF